VLLLTSTSDKIQVITSAATAVGVHASWVDLSGTTVTPGRSNTSIASAATTDVVASPAASTQRNVKFLSVWNDASSGSQTITIRHTDGTTAVDVWQGTVPAQTGVIFDEASGWRVSNPYPAADVQTFDFPGGTWTKPAGPRTGLTLMRLWGAGGGGAGGASLATAAVAKGGSGGGGGACVSQIFLTDELPDQLRVTIGSGGLGGAGGLAGAAGFSPTGGGNSFVRSPTTVFLTAFGGAGGVAGAITAVATSGGTGAGIHAFAGAVSSQAAGLQAVSGSNSSAFGPAWEGGGGGGGSNNSATVPIVTAGGNSRWGGGGGGAGGCHSNVPATVAASAGGGTGNGVGATAAGLGGAAGTSGASPTNGENGVDTDGIVGGTGGGGGGTTVTASTAGANGGNGGKGGGGGGGGGVGMNAGIGGSGGNGGHGYGVAISW
jgi:hypothetical protein